MQIGAREPVGAPFQQSEQLVPGGHMKKAQPRAKGSGSHRPERTEVAEIDHMDKSVGAHSLACRSDCGTPVGNHRETVGEDRMVKLLLEPEKARCQLFGERELTHNP